MKHSELRHQPRHVNPRIQVKRDAVQINVAQHLYLKRRNCIG